MAGGWACGQGTIHASICIFISSKTVLVEAVRLLFNNCRGMGVLEGAGTTKFGSEQEVTEGEPQPFSNPRASSGGEGS